jgi:hypothetical protein
VTSGCGSSAFRATALRRLLAKSPVEPFGGDAIIEVEFVVLEVNFVWRYLKVVSIR